MIALHPRICMTATSPTGCTAHFRRLSQSCAQRFLVDKHPVTNALYHAFLLASGYRPQFSQNFLLHWEHDATAPRGGTLNQPVRWVSLRDARAYCHYYGKRLPRDYEWALAAMSYDLHTYPWGEEWDPSRVPVASHANEMGEPEDVGLHPGGASTFGVEDLVAHIWQVCCVFLCRRVNQCLNERR